MKTLAIIAALVLSASSLFASADLATSVSSSASVIRAGFPFSVGFTVRNNGSDTATGVTLAIASSVPVTCACDLGDIPAGQLRLASVTFDAPTTNSTLTVTGTASSSTPDSNPANDSASFVLTVSSDPDINLGLGAPLTVDLALPFPVSLFLSNTSKTTAHMVEVTLDFRTDVTVQSLPANCSNTTAGRVLCRLDSFPPTAPSSPVMLSLKLVAPSGYGNGLITFTAIATEEEHDFDPVSNTKTLVVPLYKTMYVVNTANDGSGSLRQAILDANATCLNNVACAIAFRIAEASPNPWKTIRVTSPLPALTAPLVRIDGGTQTSFFGDTNPAGPEIEISGGGVTDSDGLTVTSCAAEVANLAVNGFGRNGISVTCGSTLHNLFVGTDPTGAIAKPNARGIGTSVPNGSDFNSTGGATIIQDCVISGNTHSGIFGLSGRLNVRRNRIGVKAHADEPLPNGGAGVFIGPGGYGSDVGADEQTIVAVGNAPDKDGNVIAFNGEMGVAVAAGVGDVSIRSNHIWGNALLGIDAGLDGHTETTGAAPTGTVTVPALTLAHYDPALRQTIVEGDVTASTGLDVLDVQVDFFANDAPDSSGFGEGQRPLGVASQLRVGAPAHFRFAIDGDLTGQFIAATATRVRFVGFAKPEGITTFGSLTQTSEFSRAIEVR
jgi:hypothetical protein